MTIKLKLFLITVIPITIMVLLSFNYVLNNYNDIKTTKSLLKSTDLLESINELLFEIQYERGLSTSFSNTKQVIFKNKLLKQYIQTDKSIKKFIEAYERVKTKEVQRIYKKNFLSSSLDSIPYIRKSIHEGSFSPIDSFLFYSKLNHRLLKLIKGVELYSTNQKIYTNIKTLELLTSFREYAGKERALVSILSKGKASLDMLTQYNNAINSQYLLLEDLKNKLHVNEYNNYLLKIRKQIIEQINTQDIDIEEWVHKSTQRINDYHKEEVFILAATKKDLQNIIDNLYANLYWLSAIVITIISFLLLNSYLVATNIVRSLKTLSEGVDNFFNYLNFHNSKAQKIKINSTDEIFHMAEKINKQIVLLELNLENDKDFIQEITHISILMKDGDFSEKLYFEPTNPSLIELKNVFNELVTLITDKVKEQTKEVESINAKLSDEVYFQTLDLEQKIQDITRARDLAVAAEKSKDDFLANMSHEIRTPLNAILGFVTILKKRIVDPKNTSYLNIIDTSGNSLLAIINDILDFSKIQSGKFTITPNEINPIEELSNVTILFASKAYEKHLLYAVYIDPTLPQTIHVDDVRVKQILSNILSNAIKFTPRDGLIKVRILIENEELIISVQDSGIGIAKENINKVFSAFEQADGTTTRKYGGTGLGLSISSKLAALMDGELNLVSTEGKGSTFTLKIPIEIIDPTPKEFFDLNKIQKYKFAILNTTQDSVIFTRVIKKYLSDLNITNVIELNEYTTEGYDILFFVPNDTYNEEVVDAEIPAIAMIRSNQIKLAPLDHITSLYAPFAPTSVIQAIDDITIENIQEFTDEDQSKEDVIEDSEEEVLFNGNILIAEDNKTNQMLIKLILMDYELDFKIANDGVEAVEMYKSGTYDLILMDENMPNLNGLGAMEQIKEYEKENDLDSTPIIALTANALVSDIEKFLSAGMDGFVAKPIDTKLLEIELAKHLQKV